MLYDWSDLPANAVAETVRLPGGRTITFYKVPFPRQGPEIRRDRTGHQYLAYMYAHFVFRWYAGESTVRIFHGELGGKSLMPLPWSFNIDEQWDRVILAERGKKWVCEHLAKFTKPPGGNE